MSLPQGVYSFCIYDSHKRAVFAARDPSGREPLFYAVDEDEAIRWAPGSVSVIIL